MLESQDLSEEIIRMCELVDNRSELCVDVIILANKSLLQHKCDPDMLISLIDILAARYIDPVTYDQEDQSYAKIAVSGYSLMCSQVLSTDCKEKITILQRSKFKAAIADKFIQNGLESLIRDVQSMPVALETLKSCMSYDSGCCVQLLKMNILSNLLLTLQPWSHDLVLEIIKVCCDNDFRTTLITQSQDFKQEKLRLNLILTQQQLPDNIKEQLLKFLKV